MLRFRNTDSNSSHLQEEEADTEDDDEYVPPTLIMDTELDFGEIEPEASIVQSLVGIQIRITGRGKLTNLIFCMKLCFIRSGSGIFPMWDSESIP
jgi:hypothetical protein